MLSVQYSPTTYRLSYSMTHICPTPPQSLFPLIFFDLLPYIISNNYYYIN